MDPRDYICQYIDRHGGPKGASERLGIPYPTIASVRNGHRGISRGLAERMAKADASLDPKILVWVKPTKSDADTRESADA